MDFSSQFLTRFGSSWGRFGTHLGSQNRPKKFTEIYPRRSGYRSCDWMVPRWLQDRPKRAPGGVLGPSWGGLGPLLGALGPSLEGLGGLLSRLEGSWALLERSWRPMRLSTGRFGMRFVDSIHRFDLLMRFVDSIRSSDRSMVLHHVVNTCRLNNSARRNVRSD